MFALALSTSLALGAPALKEKPAPESTLLGEWVPVSVTVGGRPSPPSSDRWAFRPDGTWAISAGGKELASGPLTGNAKLSPGTADLVDAASGIVNLCRYEVIGDTLTLSVGHCRAGRPAGLDPAPKATVWEFKRVVKKD